MRERTGEIDMALVERAKSDPLAFGELYDRSFPLIYRFVYSRTRNQETAEDVTSEVYMKAMRALPRYQDTGRPFMSWLYQIAVNAVSDRYRSSRPTVDIDDLHDLGTGAPGPEELAGRSEEMRAVWSVIETLPPPQRTALVLKFQEDMTLADIGAIMNKSEGAIKLLIHRGMTRLRAVLATPEAAG